LIEARRTAQAERARLANERWALFQLANRRRYEPLGARRQTAPFARLLSRGKTPGRMLLLAGSHVWDEALDVSLGSTPGPTAGLAAYVRAGPNPGVQPRALFDQSWYLDHASGLAGSRWALLAHYLVVGDSHNLSPHPLLNAPAYRARHGARMAARRFTALEDYLFEGAAEGVDPHPLFNTRYYVGQSGDLATSGENPLVHYLRAGWREGLEPHPLFAGNWYLERNPDARAAGVAPLLHYVTLGAPEGRDPHPLFDGAWYARQGRGRLRGGDALGDYLAAGARELRSPNPQFDPRHYLDQTGADAAARANPMLHYLTVGAFEGWSPAPDFDEAGYFLANPQAADSALSALDHWTRFRAARPANAAPAGRIVSAETLFGDLRRATAPDPDAYDNAAYASLRRPRTAGATPAPARVIAIRRTTPPSWLAVAAALPSYRGQIQPRLPADGFTDPALTLARDVALAQRYGLFGFCHEVADAQAAARICAVDAPPFPFCVAWTGGGKAALALKALATVLAAPEFIHVDGRPVIVLPPKAKVAVWREAAEPIGGLFLIQRGGAADPAFDAHLPETPNRAPEGPPGAVINPDFRGLVHDHAALVREAMATPVDDKAFPLIVAARDTTPLSPDAPSVWHGASPGALQARLEGAADDLSERDSERRLIFVHAWNDWDTGAVLAPDLRFGHGWLEAVANAADADLLAP
jgi:hypothetical protein